MMPVNSLIILGLILLASLLLIFTSRGWYRLKRQVDTLNGIFHLVETSKDIIYHFEVKPDFKYTYISPAINSILSPNLVEESLANPLTAFERIHPDDYDILLKKVTGKLDYNKPIRQRWRNDDGYYIWFEEYATPIYKNKELIAIQGVIRNIDDKVKMEEELNYKVTHDTLTGIYNREYFEIIKDQYNTSHNSAIGIVLCDIDGLKFVNDHYGHKVGDSLIKSSAHLLNQYAKEDYLVTRIGGDEFAILIVNKKPEVIELFLAKVEAAIHAFNRTSNEVFQINISFGYAYSRYSVGKMDQLFIEADQNMYRDKNKVTMF